MGVVTDRKLNSVAISLNGDLYDIDSVKSCAEDFAHLCTAEISSDGGGGRVTVILKASGEADISILGHEFCNCLLASMKNNNRV